MSHVLIDSSVWISFFKGLPESKPLFELIDTNRICVNELILAELLPALTQKKEQHLADVLRHVECIPLNIDWEWIVEIQCRNLANGINKVGIPDLIIAQSAYRNGIPLYSFDKHFELMRRIVDLKVYRP